MNQANNKTQEIPVGQSWAGATYKPTTDELAEMHLSHAVVIRREMVARVDAVLRETDPKTAYVKALTLLSLTEIGLFRSLFSAAFWVMMDSREKGDKALDMLVYFLRSRRAIMEAFDLPSDATMDIGYMLSILDRVAKNPALLDPEPDSSMSGASSGGAPPAPPEQEAPPPDGTSGTSQPSAAPTEGGFATGKVHVLTMDGSGNIIQGTRKEGSE